MDEAERQADARPTGTWCETDSHGRMENDAADG
jgi:hypothetical protein